MIINEIKFSKVHADANGFSTCSYCIKSIFFNIKYKYMDYVNMLACTCLFHIIYSSDYAFRYKRTYNLISEQL